MANSVRLLKTRAGWPSRALGLLLLVLAGGTVADTCPAPGERAPDPVHWAALTGDAKALAGAVAAGAAVDGRDPWGRTPLMQTFLPLVEEPTASGPDPAAWGRHLVRQTAKLALAERLMALGADPSAADCAGMTALHYLVLMRAPDEPRLAVLAGLLARGADPGAANRDGIAPLMSAGRLGDRPMALALLAAGADPDAVSAAGETAAAMAHRAGHAGLARRLAAAGRAARP